MTRNDSSFSSAEPICAFDRPVKDARSLSVSRPSMRERMKPSTADKRKDDIATASPTTFGIFGSSANPPPRDPSPCLGSRGGVSRKCTPV
jgi:hypothetical protein